MEENVSLQKNMIEYQTIKALIKTHCGENWTKLLSLTSEKPDHLKHKK